MISRIKFALISLLLVLAAFGTYRVLAVPLIEPAAQRFHGSDDNFGGIDLESFRARQAAEMQSLFPEGAWELKNPKIIETSRGKLLFETYKNIGDGVIEMQPFTMIFYPSDSEMSREERARRAVVIETESGATLQFDEDLDLRRAQFGRLIGASIPGKVLIRSDNREVGEHDDLRVETRDVKLSEEMVATDAEVVFRLGENHGSGRQLRIALEGEGKDAAASQGPQVAGIEKFSLMRDVQMHLSIAVDNAFGSDDEPQTTEPAEESPVTIVCQGPFEFDMKQYLIQFNDQVVVERVNRDTPPDRLTCEELLLYLTTAAPDGSPMAAPTQSPDGKAITSQKLVAKRIVARGPHVVMDAGSSGAHAEGESLEYDFVTETISLHAKQGALIRSDGNELVAPEILYRMIEGRTFGNFYARGKGHLSAVLPQGDVSQVLANWSEELRVYPDPEHPDTLVMAMRGDGHIEAPGMGSLDGQEVYAWVIEKQPVGQIVAAAQPLNPQAGPLESGQFEPEKLLAIGNVQIDSPQLNAAVDRLEMWFAAGPPLPKTVNAVPQVDPQVGQVRGASYQSLRPVIAASYNPQGGGYRQQRAAVPQQAVPMQQVPFQQAPVQRVPFQQAPLQQAPLGQPPVLHAPVPQAPVQQMPVQQPPAESPPSKMYLTGGKLQAEVVLRGREASLSQLVVEKNVTLSERRIGPDDRPPLKVTCDHLFLRQPNPTQALLTLTGEPAHVEAGGMGLDGGQIQLDRATNHLWIDGPGVMSVDGRADAAATGPLAGGGPMRVVWAGRMDFDGQAAIVSQEVVARTDAQSLTTEWMQVRLDRRVDFTNPQSDQQPEVATVDCRGGVLLESKEATPTGQLSSVTTLQVVRVLLDQRSGEIDCTGPGEVISVRRGSAQQNGMLAGLQRNAPAQQQPGNADELNYLNVRFLKSITGNLHRRQMSFNDEVRTVYGPVPTWDAKIDIEESAQLGESVVLMNCDRLNLAEVPGMDRETRFVELEAVGNAIVESLLYTARAHRITYAQAKDALTLEGNARNDAKLFLRENVGGRWQETEAKLIRYRTSTGEVDVDAPSRLDILQVPK